MEENEVELCTGAEMHVHLLPTWGLQEANQKVQRAREVIRYLCRRGRRAVPTPLSCCLPKPAGCPSHRESFVLLPLRTQTPQREKRKVAGMGHMDKGTDPSASIAVSHHGLNFARSESLGIC